MRRKANSNHAGSAKRAAAPAPAMSPREKLRPASDGKEEDSYLPEPTEPRLSEDDDLAEELAEEYLISATSGEQAAEDIRNQDTPEDEGGPFVETTLAQEIDYEDDEPADSEAEPFPTTTSSEEEDGETD